MRAPKPTEVNARRRLLLYLTLAAAAGFLLALPYLLPLLRAAGAQAQAAGRPMPPMAVVVLGQLLQSVLVAAGCAWVGTRMAPRTGLVAPFFRALAERRPAGRSLLAELPLALALGTLFSVAVLALNHLAGPALPEVLRRHAPPAMAASDKLLAVLTGASSAAYGGIVEELLLRWGLLTLLAACLARLGARGAGGFWAANLVSALLFGAGHLPAAFKIAGPLALPVIGYVVAANAVAGLACGWLFRRRGLEAAMISHGWGDVCLHELPLLVG